MKKTLSINFSGRLITIDEDAYDQLQQYIDTLKLHFAQEQGKDEIIADIENRIGEIFYAKLTNGSASIATPDVQEIIATIGKPEDFEPVENTGNTTNDREANHKQYIKRGRLTRNSNDKMLGGVCSGIAAYFNIDTVLVRLILVVLIFGAGFGFLLYIALWVFLPQSSTVGNNAHRRLYRSNDDRIFGGVAGGIAQYFNIDVWIPRVIFALPFLFALIRSVSHMVLNNFFDDSRFWSFSFGGTTTVVYILLWWIIPVAKTVQEKMAMKGEKLDLNSIKNNIQDGLKSFTDKANAFGKDVTQRSQEWTSNFADDNKERIQQAQHITRSTSNKIGSGIAILIKGCLLFIGGIAAFALFIFIITLIFGSAALWPLKAFLFDGAWANAFAWLALLVVVVPAAAFIVWMSRRIFKLRSSIRPVKVVLGILFLVGFVSAICLGTNIARGFQYSNDKYDATELPMPQPTSILTVQVSQPEITYTNELPWVHIDDAGFDITNDTLKYANIKLRFELSNDSLYHTRIKKYSLGNTVTNAQRRAEKIGFDITTTTNNVVDLGAYISVSKNEQFRGQQVLVIIEIPEGKKIQFDPTIDKLHPFTVRVNERYNNGRRRYRRMSKVYFENDYSFDYKVNTPYYMNTAGELKLVSEGMPSANTNNAITPSKMNIDSLNNVIEKAKRIRDSVENTTTTTLHTYSPITFVCMMQGV